MIWLGEAGGWGEARMGFGEHDSQGVRMYTKQHLPVSQTHVSVPRFKGTCDVFHSPECHHAFSLHPVSVIITE